MTAANDGENWTSHRQKMKAVLSRLPAKNPWRRSKPARNKIRKGEAVWKKRIKINQTTV